MKALLSGLLKYDLHAMQARGEPGGEALASPIVRAAQHAAHIHKAVDGALAAVVFNRHARGRESIAYS